MNLPRDIARCHGISHDSPGGVITHQDCIDCARRVEGIADYMAGEAVVWMEPPKETPCGDRLAYKREGKR
jgi:hypothetical protein